MTKEMERHLGKSISHTNDAGTYFDMTLDKIAYKKIGGITNKLDDSDFPVFVNKELDTWCSLEWIGEIHKKIEEHNNAA